MEQDYGYQVVDCKGIKIEPQFVYEGVHKFKESVKLPFPSDSGKELFIMCKCKPVKETSSTFVSFSFFNNTPYSDIKMNRPPSGGYTAIWGESSGWKQKEFSAGHEREIEILSFTDEPSKQKFRELFNTYFEY